VYSEKPKEPITNINPHINPQRTLVDGLVADDDAMKKLDKFSFS
jgi:hypothetical protein